MNEETTLLDKDGTPAKVTETVQIEGMTPIVIDLGKRSKKNIRNLKQGRGKLMAEVAETIEQVRSNLALNATGIVPVVLIYRQKTRARRAASSLLPLIPPPFNLLRP
jgi:Family of unknown function (DUF6200)